MPFCVMGTGSALPARVVTNDELSEFLDTSDEWIFSRTGILKRHICTTETLDDLACEASISALADAGVTPDELDLILCTTTSGDHLMPAEACAVAEALGAHCAAFDISAACAGFIFALDVAEGWFVRGKAKHILIVSAEKFSRLLDWTDRTTCVLFGDGAAAAVLGLDEQADVLWLHTTTMPDVSSLNVAGLTGKSPYDECEHAASLLTMRGRRIFKFSVEEICHEVIAACDAVGISLDSIDHFVFHQANERILSAAQQRLGISNTKVAHTLATTGNISSACIPYALDRLAKAHKLNRGQLVLLVGFGAGLDVGSCLLRW